MSEPVAGLVVVDKPGAMTSHDVVSRVRRLAGTRKVGHAGTLDPMATGVLVLGVGRATRLLGHLLLTEKAYDATIRLGASTTTDDAEGEVRTTADTATVTDEAIRDALAGMVGEIDQVPSAVSAVKVDGRRAYARVRAGEDVALAPRCVTIHAIEVREIRRAGEFLDIDLGVRCSSGTYIRAIARDVGRHLEVGGHLTALRRTAVGPFALDAARRLEQLEDSFAVLSMEDACARVFPTLVLDEAGERDVRVGRALVTTLPARGPVAVYAPSGEFLALYEQQGDRARAVAVFC